MPPSELSGHRPPSRKQFRRHQRLESDQLVAVYLTAHEVVVAAGFAAEIDWQDRLCLDTVNESAFLGEAAWVILSAGMREAVVRDRFGRVAVAFLDWESAEAIARCRSRCIRRALAAFRHPGKIAAIGDVATLVAAMGFDCFREGLRSDGLRKLEALPFIGPVTRYHLAKNIGLDVVKPDRHLVRMASAAGFADPDSMCRVIAHVTGDRLATVDLVLWRFATLDREYLNWFQPTPGRRGHAHRSGRCAA